MPKTAATKKRRKSPQIHFFSPPRERLIVSGTTTNEELALYGIPKRPGPKASSGARELWKQAYERELRFIIPELRTVPNKRHRLGRSRKKLENGDVQSNWSGSILPANGDLFKDITGTWAVPDVDLPNTKCNGQTFYCSVWVGIGGTTATNIIQAGIEHEIICTGGQTTRTLYVWAQWYPQDEQRVANFPMAIDDNIQVKVELNSLTQFTASFTNLSQGNHSAFQVETEAAPGGYSGTSAEWIVERPTLGSSFGSLADYGSVVFSGLTATTATGVSKDGSTGNLITMLDNSNSNPLSTPNVAGGQLTVSYTA